MNIAAALSPGLAVVDAKGTMNGSPDVSVPPQESFDLLMPAPESNRAMAQLPPVESPGRIGSTVDQKWQLVLMAPMLNPPTVEPTVQDVPQLEKPFLEKKARAEAPGNEASAMSNTSIPIVVAIAGPIMQQPNSTSVRSEIEGRASTSTRSGSSAPARGREISDRITSSEPPPALAAPPAVLATRSSALETPALRDPLPASADLVVRTIETHLLPAQSGSRPQHPDVMDGVRAVDEQTPPPVQSSSSDPKLDDQSGQQHASHSDAKELAPPSVSSVDAGSPASLPSGFAAQLASTIVSAPAQSAAEPLSAATGTATTAQPTDPSAPVMGQPVKSLHFDLHPADLGSVSVRLTMRNDSLHLNLSFSKKSTADLARADLQTLTLALSSAGLPVEGMHIESGGIASQPGSAQTDAGRNPSGQRQSSESSPRDSNRDGAGSEHQRRGEGERREADASPAARAVRRVASADRRAGLFV